MIEISHVYFSYTGHAPWVLQDLSLSVPQGSYISILGENGCGKSTLMRLILGFLTPARGRITCQARRIGYVPQRSDFTNSAFPITVWEVMDSYRRLLHIKDPAATMHALAMTGTESLRNRLMGTLSGGQHQKVLLARALLGAPDLLILDEPSTGVDVKGQNEIYQLLSDFHKREGLTILAVEHNLPKAMGNSDHLYCIEEGTGTLHLPSQYHPYLTEKGELHA